MKLSSKQIKEIVNYWRKTAEHDYDTMLYLHKSGRYSDALFFGHIVIEKILKAHSVAYTSKEAPKTHDLISLEKLSNLKLNENQRELLKAISNFNIRSRYPDYKFRFYKSCTKLFTEKYIVQIKNLFNELCRKLK